MLGLIDDSNVEIFYEVCSSQIGIQCRNKSSVTRRF